jgi:hypothetical protein
MKEDEMGSTYNVYGREVDAKLWCKNLKERDQ